VLEEDKSGEGDSLMTFGPVKGVSNEKREFGLRMGRGRRVFGTGEKMCDKMSAKSCDVLMTIKRVWL
jgi:hypothetical protein